LKKPTIFFIAVILTVHAHAQESFDQYLYWLRYQNQLIFNSNWYLNTDFDNRRFFDPDVENQFIIHTRIHYKKGPWDFGGGLTFSWAYAARPENGYKNPVMEFRPVVEANHEIPFKKFSIHNRLRIDNRFFEIPGESLLDSSYYVMRFRYRLMFRMPLKFNEDKVPVITFRVADEIMLNTKENTFDQNRVNITSEFYVTRNFTLELGYIYIYQQRYGTDDFFNRNVLRFSVIHRVFM